MRGTHGVRLGLVGLLLPVLVVAQSPSVAQQAPVVSRGQGVFVALSVPDLQASVAWYTRTFGLRQVFAFPETGPIVGGATLEGAGLVVELLQHREARPGSTPAELAHGVAKVGMLVDDFDGTVSGLRARGVTFFSGPHPARPGQRANVMFKDNAGNMWQVLGPLTPQ